MIHEVGVAAVGRTLASIGAFLPLLLLLEAAWMGADVLVLRALLGPDAARVTWGLYMRSAVTAYAINVFSPAGRAAAEVARSAMLAPVLGGPRAAVTALRLQGTSLLGTASILAVSGGVAVARLGVAHRLCVAIGIAALLTMSIGAMLTFAARSARLFAIAKRLSPRLPDLEEAARHRAAHPVRAYALATGARVIQCGQFYILLLAIAGRATPAQASLAQGVSLAGSTIGDVVPQQAGVAEGAFYYFADAIGLTAPGGVSVAVGLRCCLLVLGLLALVTGVAWTHAPSATPRAVPPRPEAKEET